MEGWGEQQSGMTGGRGGEGRDRERQRNRTAESFQEREMILICHRQNKKGRLHNILNDSVSVAHPEGSHYVYYALVAVKVLLASCAPKGMIEGGGSALPDSAWEVWKFSFRILQGQFLIK